MLINTCCFLKQLECAQINLYYLYIEICHPIAQKTCQNISQISVLKTFLKSQFCTQSLAPSENLCQCLKMRKQMVLVQHQINKLHFNQQTSFITFWDITYFVQWSLKFCNPFFELFALKNWKMQPQNFELFALKNLKMQTWQTPHLHIVFTQKISITGMLPLSHTKSKRPKRSKFQMYLDYETAVHSTRCLWVICFGHPV